MLTILLFISFYHKSGGKVNYSGFGPFRILQQYLIGNLPSVELPLYRSEFCSVNINLAKKTEHRIKEWASFTWFVFFPGVQRTCIRHWKSSSLFWAGDRPDWDQSQDSHRNSVRFSAVCKYWELSATYNTNILTLHVSRVEAAMSTTSSSKLIQWSCR